MLRTLFEWLLPKPIYLSGEMVSTFTEAETGATIKMRYSAYSEYEYFHEDEKLFIRFVCTFGMERVPQGDMFRTLTRKKKQEWTRDGLLPWVGELYFINYADHLITVKPLSLTMQGETVTFDKNQELSPQVFVVTPPLVQLGSNFATEIDIAFSFEYEGKVIDIEGTAYRKTVEEIKSKYSA